MACKEWEEYFHHFSPPSSLTDMQKAVRDFTAHNRCRGRNLVLVTSGGTTVPLENNTVRFVDNFSIGSRGSSSAEYFLDQGYAVVFLHRQHSLQPFSRQFDRSNFLEYLEVELSPDGTERVGVKSTMSAKLIKVLKRYDEVKASGRLLLLTFVTVSDYLFVLRACAESLSTIGPHVMFYLAAAVSDFYVPSCEMPEHKIQSSTGPLELKMQPTPKLLSPLVKDWAKEAFVVSFKLETDVDIIAAKARDSLEKYNHQVVISNLLATRRKQVTLVTKSEETSLCLTDSELSEGVDIEQKIVNDLIQRHRIFTEQKH